LFVNPVFKGKTLFSKLGINSKPCSIEHSQEEFSFFEILVCEVKSEGKDLPEQNPWHQCQYRSCPENHPLFLFNCAWYTWQQLSEK